MTAVPTVNHLQIFYLKSLYARRYACVCAYLSLTHTNTHTHTNSNAHSQFRTTEIEEKIWKNLCKDIHLHSQLEVCKLEPFLTYRIDELCDNTFYRPGYRQADTLIHVDLNADWYDDFG